MTEGSTGSQRLFPAVTVAIPACNLEQYLADTVASVQAQDYDGPLCILIWDDGSHDGTRQVAEHLAREDSRIVVRHHPNQGRAVTRQVLLNAADTELIAWIDADDLASPAWIREQVEFLQSDPRRVAVGGQGYAMTAQGDAIGPMFHPRSHEEIHQQHLSGQANAFFQSCVLTQAAALKAAGGYRAQYFAAEDFDLWLRLAEVGRLESVNSVHLYYRVHPTSANWTINVDQRKQGVQIVNQARAQAGLAPIDLPQQVPPSPRKDDWNRRVYWVNIAAREGNPWTCLKLLVPALQRHPLSLVLWLFALIAVADFVLLRGNRTRRFVPGRHADIRPAPHWSVYRLARGINRCRRRVIKGHW